MPPRRLAPAAATAALSIAALAAPVRAELDLPANILRIEANMVVDDPAEILALVDRGAEAGATAILVNDSKATRWGVGEPQERWRARMAEVRAGVAERGLDFGFNTVTLGFGASILAADPSLVAGVPVVDQPLEVDGDALVPVPTATLAGGDFEGVAGTDRVPAARFQDAPGERTTVDDAVARSGSASLRADATGDEMSRIGFRGTVAPWHQYTVSVWVRAEALVARNLQVVIRDPATGRDLTSQWPSLPAEGGGREYLRGVDGRSFGWTELRLPFNSREATEVQVVLAVFGGRSGSVWWDDLAIEDTPTMNWIRRDGLDTRVADAAGAPLVEGRDVDRVEDPLLGRVRYPGDFDTYHAVAPIGVPAGSRLADGDRVLLSGWHAQITARGQKAASWNDSAVHRAVERVHRRLASEFSPEFFHYNDSETRTGGFEPTDAADSGEAFARGARRNLAGIARGAGDATVLVWSDMYDPFHNARDGYYQVRGDLDGSWRGLDAERVIVVNWWSKDKLRGAEAPASVAHFAGLGFRQILAGYYEEDVADNRAAWRRAAAGSEGSIVGSMFYTNLDGYRDLAEFGRQWWR